MRIVDSPFSLLFLLLMALIGILLLFKLENLLGKLSLNPYSVVHRKRYYQLFTSIFVHYDLIHLLFNLLTFYFFAPQLELTIGSIPFALLFLSSGIVASLPSLIKYRHNPYYYSLGASGAISGVIFSYILFYPTSRIYIFFFPLGIPSPLFALLYLFYCIYASKKESNINHEAHFWGAVWGLIFTIMFFPDSFLILLDWIKRIL